MRIFCLPFALSYHRKRYKLFAFFLVVFALLIIFTARRKERTGTGFRYWREHGISNKTTVSLDVFNARQGDTTRQQRSGRSGLNVHIWSHLCLSSIQVLCDYPLFYTAPNHRVITRKLDIIRNVANYGQRIFGFLHPPKTGKYKFAIASDDSSELWLSPNEDSSSVIMICNSGERNEEYVFTERGEFTRFSSQISDEIELQEHRKYYIEILHVQAAGDDFVQVAWLKPGANKFEVIKENAMSLFVDDSEHSKDFESAPTSTACARTVRHHHSNRMIDSTPQYLPHESVKDVLPYCNHKPIYPDRQEKLKSLEAYRYAFINEFLFPVDSYPPIGYKNVFNTLNERYGTNSLDARTAGKVAKLYLNSLYNNYPGKFQVLSLVNVERKAAYEFSTRFLLEFKVTVTGQTEPLMISEYVFMAKNDSSLCYPEGRQWNRKARIALVITLKNQGRWMVHFLNNLEEMYAATQDQDVSLVIFNYNSSDINLEKELEKRKLPPYKVVNYQAQHYSRTRSFNQAVKQVDDPHTIIFTLDLHLELPNSFFDDIRKHCFEGISVYTPIIVRLSCGSLPAPPRGRWEPQGFGLIGLFKSDWDRIGGMNEFFDEAWGGEDWDLMGRVVQFGLEYERVRHPGIFHFFHTRKGLWTGDEEIQSVDSV